MTCINPVHTVYIIMYWLVEQYNRRYNIIQCSLYTLLSSLCTDWLNSVTIGIELPADLSTKCVITTYQPSLTKGTVQNTDSIVQSEAYQ